ncbi:MAG TPA: hypothetical protein VGF55_22670, partial [Gemmataceae bacterium]
MSHRVRQSFAALAVVTAWLAAAPAPAQVIFTENFNSPSTILTTGGWVSKNNSVSPDPAGSWGPPGNAVTGQPGALNPPQSGATDSYFATDVTATSDPSTTG